MSTLMNNHCRADGSSFRAGRIHSVFTALAALLCCLSAAEELPFDFPAEVFEVGGYRAFIIHADKPAAGSPWVWYAPTLKTGNKVFNFPNKTHAFYFDQLTAQGISVAGIDLGEVRGSPSSIDRFADFHAEMVRRGFSAKPVLLGQSRGGLMLLSFAVRHPAKLAAFAGIFPVLNLSSYPLKGSQVAVTLADFGMTLEELTAELETHNPVLNVAGLAEARVPFFMVHGDSDLIVPWKDNGQLLVEYYLERNAPVDYRIIEGKGHELDPAFFNSQELADFVIAHAGAGHWLWTSAAAGGWGYHPGMGQWIRWR
jgi:predicted esterase